MLHSLLGVGNSQATNSLSALDKRLACCGTFSTPWLVQGRLLQREARGQKFANSTDVQIG